MKDPDILGELKPYKAWESKKFKMVDTTKRSKGLWFYGLSGSGKSFASSICKEFTTNAFVLDGDDVRKYVSTDLSYSESDRKVQTKRILGISKIVIENNMFPIISTVTMQSDLLSECNKLQIEVILLNRSMDQIHQVREIYKNESNVVGKDIFLQKFDTRILTNDGTINFNKRLRDLFG